MEAERRGVYTAGMRLLCSCLALAVVLILAPVGTVARENALPATMVDAPPLATDAGAEALFDAMVAIGRAKATYPAGAADAATRYAAALKSYYAGDQTAAWTGALGAIAVATKRPYPEPQAWQSPSPTVQAVAPMPEIVDVAQAQAESTLFVGRRALMTCGVSDSSLLQALRQRYSAGVAENLRHQYDQVLADAQTIIDACAAAPAPSAPSATPTAH
jgi:hypothetical protein